MEGIELPFLKLRPMLAVSSPPFDSPRFIYEVKWDGYRALAFLDGKTRLQSHNLMDITPLFPEMGRLHLQVEGQPAVLDGEIIAVDREGKPSFSLLQTQGGLGLPDPTRLCCSWPLISFITRAKTSWPGPCWKGSACCRKR